MLFSPELYSTFEFNTYDYNEVTGLASFSYSLIAADGQSDIQFAEQLTFKNAPPLENELQATTFHNCLKFLHLAIGVSYYKLAAPKIIKVKTDKLPKDIADFFTKLYINGLSEFAYINDIQIENRVAFPDDQTTTAPTQTFKPTPNILVPVGGGKDSLLTMELLRAKGHNFTTFYLGSSPVIESFVAQSNYPHISVERKLSPNIFELNKSGALNGHVPISSIISFTSIAICVLYGFDTVITSNERSANIPNTTVRDLAVNHQYSKSMEFEMDFAKLVENHLNPDIVFFSLLRPFSELKIAQHFSQYPQHHHQFASCNKNFKIYKETGSNRWCNNCPKCRFVFLSLAPFIEKHELINIFGKNILNAPEQLDGYKELIGYGAIKPFECVGEIDESLAALILLSRKSEWLNDLVIQWFLNEVAGTINNPDSIINEVMLDSKLHRIPDLYQDIFDET